MRLFIILLALFLTGCGNDTLMPSKAKAEGKRDFTILTRVGSTMRPIGDAAGASGFDRDLVERFAQECGIRHRIVVAASDTDLWQRLANGEADMAAAWQSPGDRPGIRSGVPYADDQSVLVTHEASLPLAGVAQLAGKTVYVVSGSRQEAVLLGIKDAAPYLVVSPTHKSSELDLMENVALRRIEAALVSRAEFDVGNNYYPELQNALLVGQEQPVVWLFGPKVTPDFVAKANAFIRRMQDSGEMDRLKDRYFGHVDRLTPLHSVRFIEGIRGTLPKYRSLFETAQAASGIDWRLLAALAYQESQWNPLATSATGVRGMMMLTEETADERGVDNRLDAAQSIRAGAEYLGSLRNALPSDILEPDRTWFAVAAYNLGMGHLKAARQIAKTLKVDAASWYEMKRVLPLLAKEAYYKRLKSGKGRGGEAVIMVENIRMFVNILNRHEHGARSLGPTAQTTTSGISRPLQTVYEPELPTFRR
ncbi:MAG: membrane-bound lytic murein transglycosylase MltF [Propionivibrio sp.]